MSREIECYDIAMDNCPCPNISLDNCGMFLTNSMRNQVLITLGSFENNWIFGSSGGINYELIKNAPRNSFGTNVIRSHLESKLKPICSDIEVEVTTRNHINEICINLPESQPIRTDCFKCFSDVFNSTRI